MSVSSLRIKQLRNLNRSATATTSLLQMETSTDTVDLLVHAVSEQSRGDDNDGGNDCIRAFFHAAANIPLPRQRSYLRSFVLYLTG